MDRSVFQWLHSLSGIKIKIDVLDLIVADFDYNVCHVPESNSQVVSW